MYLYVAIANCRNTPRSSESTQDEGDTGGQEEEEVTYVLEEFLVSTNLDRHKLNRLSNFFLYQRNSKTTYSPQSKPVSLYFTFRPNWDLFALTEYCREEFEKFTTFLTSKKCQNWPVFG